MSRLDCAEGTSRLSWGCLPKLANGQYQALAGGAGLTPLTPIDMNPLATLGFLDWKLTSRTSQVPLLRCLMRERSQCWERAQRERNICRLRAWLVWRSRGVRDRLCPGRPPGKRRI